MEVLKRFKFLVIIAAFMSVLVGCESRTENGIEDVGETIEETTEDAADAVGDTAEDAKDGVEDAVD